MISNKALVRYLSLTVLWILGAITAYKFDIGALQLYFIITILIAILVNMRSSKTASKDSKDISEYSAYSVFNPGCQPLLGDLRADQLDAELRNDALNAPQPGGRVSAKPSSSAKPVDNHGQLLEKLRREAREEQLRARKKKSVG